MCPFLQVRHSSGSVTPMNADVYWGRPASWTSPSRTYHKPGGYLLPMRCSMLCTTVPSEMLRFSAHKSRMCWKRSVMKSEFRLSGLETNSLCRPCCAVRKKCQGPQIYSPPREEGNNLCSFFTIDLHDPLGQTLQQLLRRINERTAAW